MKVGFPRPWSEDYGVPTPYTAESDFAVASASDTRVNRCIVKGLCAVCGEKLDEEMYVAIFNYSEEHKNVGDITDHGMSHEKCAKIVMSFCPFFKTKDAYYVKVLKNGQKDITIFAHFS